MSPRRIAAAMRAAAAFVVVTGQSAAQEVEPSPVAFGADEVRFDGKSKFVEVTGHVRVDQPPFHFTSDALRLERTPLGVVLSGAGKLAFCLCLGAPLDVRFSGATVAPPHDVILRGPVLEVFGVPIAWLPLVWLRSAGRPGLLPPEIAWRAADGLFVGGGVHAPWRSGDMDDGLDVRAGGYVRGGVAVDVAVHSPATWTRVRWDRLRGNDGVLVGALGRAGGGEGSPEVAWEIDALRGGRAVAATADVDAAARPFDRAQAEATWRASGRAYGWTVASGARAFAPRGGALGDFGAAGPIVTLRRAEALGQAGAYDVALEGGAITGGPSGAVASGHGATSFARGELGVLLAGRLAPLRESLTVRAAGVAADDGLARTVGGAAESRLALALPLARTYESADAFDPWTHWTEPRVEAAATATAPAPLGAADALAVDVPPGRGAVRTRATTWTAGAGWSNAVARRGDRAGAEMDVAGGGVGEGDTAGLALRVRAAGQARWLGLRANFARVFGPEPVAGGALLGAARVGDPRGLQLAVHAAERDGVDPVLARALVDSTLEPSAGFLDASGWTGGARLQVPLGGRVTARGGGDVDLATGRLVDALAAFELHDPCGCVVVRATAQHRVGRPGVDVWVAIDLPSVGR